MTSDASMPPESEPAAPSRLNELSQQPVSIAELAARMTLPIGVVRVLVGDLQAAGALLVGSATPSNAATDVALLERLLDGLRAL